MAATASITNNYLSLLLPLSDDMKVSIVNALTSSMKTKQRKPTNLQSLFGAWEDDRSAEEIILEIENSRVTGTRHIESF